MNIKQLQEAQRQVARAMLNIDWALAGTEFESDGDSILAELEDQRGALGDLIEKVKEARS